MKPNPRFLNKPKPFWASVRSLSQKLGYSENDSIIFHSMEQMYHAFHNSGLDPRHICSNGVDTDLGIDLFEYFQERARVLNFEVKPKLLNVYQAKELYDLKRSEYNHLCPTPMNKQKGDMKAVAYLTALVNMMVERYGRGLPCNYDPQELTTVIRCGKPLRTLARRVDGAFLSPINPIAIWEVKEYYYNTTFGSRIADGVYETLLDGMEVEELRENENIDVKHYLMTDAYHTWWNMGKSYLCRMFDMLHMGYADEILFGREVVDEMPRIVTEWVEIYDELSKTS